MGHENIETFGQYLVDKTLPTGVITSSETDWTKDGISLKNIDKEPPSESIINIIN